MPVIVNSTTTDTQAPSSSWNVQDGSFDSINAVILPIFSAIAIILIYMPTYDFFHKKNFAMCSMIFATTILNLYSLINAAIWHSDDWDTWWDGAGLCDIEVNTRYMMSTAILASMACFTKNLANVFNSNSHSFIQTSAMKRRKLAMDILFCWGAAVLQIALHYVASNGRYSVEPTWGCDDNYDNSWPFLVFYFLPFPIFTLLSTYYSIRVLVGLHRHRTNLSSTLASSGSGMSDRYFVKLAIIACSIVIIWLPAQVYWIYRQRPVPFHLYNWDSIHDPVSWDPIVFYHSSDDPFVQYNAWTSVALALVIFVYFGFNNDAIDKYRSWLVTCGFGKIWPGLKESRQLGRRGSQTGSSLTSHFDLVSRAMHYFDGTRKSSQVPGSIGRSEATQSRKGSLGTFEHASLSQTHTNESIPTPERFTTSALTDADTDIPAPKPSSNFGSTIPDYAMHSAFTTPPKKTFFSSFRTRIDLPFHIFSSSLPTSESETHDKYVNCVALPNDVEALHHGPLHTLPSPCNTVETNIWSSTSHLASSHWCQELESPKLGTRAYRERERRDMQAIMEEAKGGAMGSAVFVTKEVERRESDITRSP